MFTPPDHRYRVPFDGSFRLESWPNDRPDDSPSKSDRETQVAALLGEIPELQRRMYAQDRRALLLVFQAMDAAGKDSTIRAVMSGIDPSGCQVYSFKRPSSEELDHDFLWRTTCRLPERGRIGVFNRSYYEEVLVVRVHPAILDGQRLPDPVPPEQLWPRRYRSIADHELHLAENGTTILKFFLNLSRKEQKKRFLDRIKEREKHWKFEAGDIRERRHWDDYMRAYEDALNATSKPWAPWFAIPADSKSWMQLQVAEIIVQTMRAMGLAYPIAPASVREELDKAHQELMAEEG